jgi:hypothetical protein
MAVKKRDVYIVVAQRLYVTPTSDGTSLKYPDLLPAGQFFGSSYLHLSLSRVS